MAKPLTEEQITNIIAMYAIGYSERDISKIYGHGRMQVRKYTERRYLAGRAAIKSSESSLKDSIMDYKEKIHKNELSLWKNLFTVAFIGFIAQVLICIFF